MTLDRDAVETSIDRAAETVGSVWPLHSFVTANPLAGLEDRPFHRAVEEAERLFGGRGYPHPSVFRRAWENGQIDPDLLAEELDGHAVSGEPETLLDQMAAAEAQREREPADATETVDRVCSKWLAAFLDEGRATWPMPGREQGFYAAWRSLAPHDADIPGVDDATDLPETPLEALEAVLSDYPQGRWETIFEYHLAALPGWTGFVKQRAADEGPWQSEYPISLLEYLAVRLTLAALLDAPIDPADDPTAADGAGAGTVTDAGAEDSEAVPLPEIWLTAWEKSYRQRLLEGIDQTVQGTATDGGSSAATDDEDSRPAAQLVFCIDTRSEIVRRHVEAAGPYETHGYAGFFGVPIRYEGYDADVPVDACPPIVDAQHRVTDRPQDDCTDHEHRHDRWRGLVSAARKHLKSLKTNAVAAFTFVEGGGSAYGAAMATRTLFPSAVASASRTVDDLVPSPAEFCSPTLAPDEAPDGDGDVRPGLTLEERVEYAATAFELMGWEAFAPLVVFTGHASETANNPFDASLDCGACAGNPGGPNARVLAAICNDEDVQAELRERGIELPEDTVFLAAEHNTTTDEITLFDGNVPASHREDVEQLRADLEEARAGATAERAESIPGADPADGVRDTERRTADWAETRPEWGLAGNASFVIGPRELTDDQDLDGRAFLHSYDWSTDPDGEALEAIVTGPLVVTQWINNQYYFATVDNAVYGSGSKVTQNPRGNVGVVQGNGGDLMTGLPLQSLTVDDERPYHQPLRLTAVIHAPVDRVTEILRDHPEVATLADNGWLSLTVVDPEQENEPFHYQGDLEWDAPVEAPLVH